MITGVGFTGFRRFCAITKSLSHGTCFFSTGVAGAATADAAAIPFSDDSLSGERFESLVLTSVEPFEVSLRALSSSIRELLRGGIDGGRRAVVGIFGRKAVK